MLPQRVLVYGVTGSGKTVLAAAIADRIGLPWHSVDDLTWEPGWVAVAAEEQHCRIATICAGSQWVVDSAYAAWLDVVLDRADLVVALDYPRWLSLARLGRRTVRRIVERQRVCNGNVETIRSAFGRDSIIVWHFRSFRRKRVRIRSWAAGDIDIPVVVLRSRRDTRSWLASLHLIS